MRMTRLLFVKFLQDLHYMVEEKGIQWVYWVLLSKMLGEKHQQKYEKQFILMKFWFEPGFRDPFK